METNIFNFKDNVNAFLEKASKEVGKSYQEYFEFKNYTDCRENEITSPIEQLLYIALTAASEIIGLEKQTLHSDGKTIFGFSITPQFKIGNYKADFLVKYFIDKNRDREVLVECDSQQFHERTEKERRYEKSRDRFFQIQGFKVFRFTGKEIVFDPFKPASEIISYLTDINLEEIIT